MSELLAVGIDPSLRAFGMAKVRIDLRKLTFRVVDVRLTETELDHSKQVRKGSDDLRRCREVITSLREFTSDVAFGFAEVPSGGAQSASALKALSMATAFLGACPAPLIEVQPSEVKLATVGRRTASKPEMIAWAIAKHPEAAWMTRKLHGKIEHIAKNEHIADAICAVYAGLRTEQFRQAVAMFGGRVDLEDLL